MALIGISGKISSGKDTVGKIIQIITNSPHFTDQAVVDFLGKNLYGSKWKVKRFADKLKDIVCLLLDCSREQLEDREFKEKELGEEWWYVKHWYPANPNHKQVFNLYPYTGFDSRMFDGDDSCMWEIVKPTPRLLLQLIGTESGRKIIHPNIWTNALMSEYKPSELLVAKIRRAGFGTGPQKLEESLPNWIITDMRFPNELKAVEDREGVTIRVNRETEYLKCIEDPAYFVETYMKVEGEKIELREYEKDFIREHCKPTKEHESETALDNARFDHVIQNDGSITDLVGKVREILTKHNII